MVAQTISNGIPKTVSLLGGQISRYSRHLQGGSWPNIDSGLNYEMPVEKPKLAQVYGVA